MGMGVKADLLTFLIGLHRGTGASVAEIQQALGYTSAAIRRSAKEVALAGLVRERSHRPAEYSTHPDLWYQLLHLGSDQGASSSWAMWSAFFAFLVRMDYLSGRVLSGNMNEFIAASAGRNGVLACLPAFEYHEIEIPDHTLFPGRLFVDALLRLTIAVANWMEENR